MPLTDDTFYFYQFPIPFSKCWIPSRIRCSWKEGGIASTVDGCSSRRRVDAHALSLINWFVPEVAFITILRVCSQPAHAVFPHSIAYLLNWLSSSPWLLLLLFIDPSNTVREWVWHSLDWIRRRNPVPGCRCVVFLHWLLFGAIGDGGEGCLGNWFGA